jgi:hypothetical protein
MFSRYTGLAYADIKKLKRSEIIIGVDGEQWLVSCRQKTDISALFPHTLFHLKILLFTLQIILIFLHQSIQDLLRPWTMAPAASFFFRSPHSAGTVLRFSDGRNCQWRPCYAFFLL